jgi:hypothetical protein
VITGLADAVAAAAAAAAAAMIYDDRHVAAQRCRHP